MDSQQFLTKYNPLTIGGSQYAEELSTPGGIVSRALVFIFPLAGMILFAMILWGGFDILATSATKKSIDAGKKRVITSIIGFLILFSSYWIVQILEVIFGFKIL